MVWDLAGAFNSVVLAMVENPFFLIFLIIGIAMIPLSLLGIYQLSKWLDTWKKLRAGWIQVEKKLSNGRWVRFWARPTGRKIKIKGEEGMEFELPVAIEKGMMAYSSDFKGDFKEARKLDEADKESDNLKKAEKKMEEIEEKVEKLKKIKVGGKLTEAQLSALRELVK